MAIVTYNMAQLERLWVDFVPCTQQRLGPQISALLTARDALIHQERDFVLLLQEVFRPEAYEQLKAAADERGLRIFPATAGGTQQNGLVTITNMPVEHSRFVAFSKDDYAQKGMLYTLVSTASGAKLAVVNVHTVFSNTSAVSAVHLRQFQEVGAFIRSLRSVARPIVVAGDFNAGPDMKYADERYPMAQTIWHRGLMPILAEHRMKWVDYVGHTWDNANSLVLNPALVIKLMNLWELGSLDWELSDSKMDHVFIGNDLKVKSSQLVLNAPVPLDCPGNVSPDGKGALSDHFGLLVSLSGP